MKPIIHHLINSKNFKHGLLYTIFSFVNNGIGFILVLILAKYLTPSEYGDLNLFNTFITLFSITIALSSTSYISVCYYKSSLEIIQKIIQGVFIISTIMLCISAVFITIMPSEIQRLVGIKIEYIIIGIAICYFSIYNNVNLDIWRLEEKPIAYGAYSLTFAVTNFILTFVFVVACNQGWVGRVYAWLLLGIIYFTISLLFLIKRNYFSFTRPSFHLIRLTLIY